MKLSLFVLILVRWISVQLKLLAGKYLGFPLVNCTPLKIGVATSVGSTPLELDVPRWIQRRSTSVTYSVPFCC